LLVELAQLMLLIKRIRESMDGLLHVESRTRTYVSDGCMDGCGSRHVTLREKRASLRAREACMRSRRARNVELGSSLACTHGGTISRGKCGASWSSSPAPAAHLPCLTARGPIRGGSPVSALKSSFALLSTRQVRPVHFR
jgi:hypothetical protein